MNNLPSTEAEVVALQFLVNLARFRQPSGWDKILGIGEERWVPHYCPERITPVSLFTSFRRGYYSVGIHTNDYR